MEDVRFYDFEFRLLHIEHALFSCNWTFYENDIGQFEMHFPHESRLGSIAAEHPYMVAVQGDKQAIITGRQLTEEGILYGRSCNWILTRFCFGDRLDTEELLTNGILAERKPETVIRYLLSQTFSDIHNFVFRESEEQFNDVFLKSDAAQPVFSLIQSVMAQAGGGHGVFFNVADKCWELYVTKGKELPIVLSENNRNAYQAEYTEDSQESFSCGYYLRPMEDMGEWKVYFNLPTLKNLQPDNYAKGYRVVLDSHDASSYWCFNIEFTDGDYIVCDSKDGRWKKSASLYDFYEKLPSSFEGIYNWTTVLEGDTAEKALENLQKCTVQKQFRIRTEAFLHGRDYQLGDKVRLQIRKGSFESFGMRKITGVHIWYEENDIGEQPIFEE